MINYSPKAAKAIAQLKRHYNDVDIFVEDTANHNMWLLIIRALLPPNTRVESVTMLGGREAVTKACELDQGNTGRRKLYIIDGDLDFLIGKRKRNLKYFYRLRCNNVENLLINENALIAMGLEHQPKKSERTIRSDLAFTDTYDSLKKNLTPLFVAYAVAHKLDPSTQTTGFSVKRLIVNTRSGPKLDTAKLRKRIVSLYLIITRKVGINRVRRERDRILSNAVKLPLEQIASGKDYILPLIILQFQAVCGYGRGDESFKVALARSFSRQSEPYFARRISRLAA